MAHEIGHAATGAKDGGPQKMNNINQNENLVRMDVGEPERISHPVK
jgi:hypothetical protein